MLAAVESQVAGIPLFSFSQHGKDRLVDKTVLQKSGGQKRDVFLQDRILQCHAGGREDNGFSHRKRLLILPQDGGCQIGIGLSHADAGIAEGRFPAKQRIQNGVAELDLPFPHRHAQRRQHSLEKLFRLPVCHLVPGHLYLVQRITPLCFG